MLPVNRPLLSGATRTALYRYLGSNGGSYNDLRMCFRNCGIEPDENVVSASTTNKDRFLDAHILPLNLTEARDAQKLANFIAQAVDFFGSDGQVRAEAKAIRDSLIRDGWELQGNDFVYAAAQLFDGQRYVTMPSSIEEVLTVVIGGVRRARYSLKNRRAGSAFLSFDDEYDFQDLLDALLQPWVRDIRREEYVASYSHSAP